MQTKKRNRLAGKGKNKRPKSNKKTGRDYSYDKEYQKSPKQVSNRVKRNAARNSAVKSGVAKRGDSTDVDHKRPLSKGGSNAKSNTRVISRSTNRRNANKKKK
jgi:hypothetical protein